MKNAHCSFCKPLDKYSHLRMKDGKSWRIELRDQQNYLGWSFIILKRHAEDLSDVKEKEWLELHELVRELGNAIKKAFNPTRFNYASFGNEINHVHLQVVPRYRRSIKLKEVIFEDKRWGSNYSPYNKKFKVSKGIQRAIIAKIASNL